jgi:hypothetical protein
MSAVVDPGEGFLLFLFVDPSRIRGRYQNWESLVWRDAGALIGGITLVASALGCASCPLGLSGGDEIKAILGMPEVMGVGVCIVGDPPVEPTSEPES